MGAPIGILYSSLTPAGGCQALLAEAAKWATDVAPRGAGGGSADADNAVMWPLVLSIFRFSLLPPSSDARTPQSLLASSKLHWALLETEKS